MVRIAYAPIYTHPLPPGHRFPMEKYELLHQQLLYEGTATPQHFFEPRPVQEAQLLRAHDLHYWQELRDCTLSPKHVRRIGFPLTPELVLRELVITQGTIDCAEHALQYGMALNIAGGTHHAYRDRGEGFCLLNDIAVAAYHLLDHHPITRILVVDLDVHQGNGTASIFAQEPRVFTFSMHGAHNYPLHKEVSDLDIALPDHTTDAVYLQLLEQELPALLERFAPQFVFYLSGVDVLHTDKLGRLGLSMEGCRRRDQLVFSLCRQHALPVCVSMGGGYSTRLSDIVNAHANTFRLAVGMFG